MKMEVHELTVRVTVPVTRCREDVVALLKEVIGEGQAACVQYEADPEVADVAALARKMECSVSAGPVVSTYGTDLECKVDVDEATYFGDENDGVYYQAFEDEDGKWWMSAIVDCDTGGFVDTLADSEGPYDTEEGAMIAGRDCAWEWCSWNEVWDAFEGED
jgi:hypothetical protein